MTRLRQSWPSVARTENVAIWRAARQGDEEKLFALLEASFEDVGRDPSSWVHARRLNWLHDRKGTSPLMAAAAGRRGAAAVSVLLAAHVVDVNAVDNTQQMNTALHYAAAHGGDPSAVENLLLAGADAFRLNRKGHTPLDEARIHGRSLAARALLEHMTVHADWLFVRGAFRWRKCWGVLLACDAAREATELCIYASPTHVRPEAVVLLDERTSVLPFASSDSYRWLRHPFAFTTSRPVLWQSVGRQQFTRAPASRKTMMRGRSETTHVVLAADDKGKLDAWIRVLTPPPTAEGARESIESFYWPRERLADGSELLQHEDVGRLVTSDAVVFEPLIPARNRSATAPAAAPLSAPLPYPLPPQILTSPMTSPRSDGEQRVVGRGTLTRRRRATSSPARQSEPALATATLIVSPLASSYSIIAPQDESEGSDDSSSEATTTDSADHESTTEATADRPEELQDGPAPALEPRDDRPEQEPVVPASPLAANARETRGQRDECLICVSAPRDAVCAPCGHLAACHACLLTAVQTFRVCPICRARVQCVMRIYDA